MKMTLKSDDGSKVASYPGTITIENPMPQKLFWFLEIVAEFQKEVTLSFEKIPPPFKGLNEKNIIHVHFKHYCGAHDAYHHYNSILKEVKNG